VTYTPTEAARILRVSPTRVRQLLQDGELDGERDEAGHWLIPARVVHERAERLRRETFVEAVVHDPSIVLAMQERVEVLRAQVKTLRAELEEAHAANRENRRIIATLAQRVPKLKASHEAREEAPLSPPSPGPTASPPAHSGVRETARVEPERAKPRSSNPQPREATQRRSLWRWVFGG
jgi:excisionase family DNA binding protein